LQDATRARRRGEQFVRFGKRGGHRFFDKYIDALFEEAAADARMLDRGHGHARSIRVAGKRFDVRKNFCGKFGRGFCSALGARVHDADEFRAGQLTVHASMIPAEISGTHNRNANFLA
jgi:hypothetical protein